MYIRFIRIRTRSKPWKCVSVWRHDDAFLKYIDDDASYRKSSIVWHWPIPNVLQRRKKGFMRQTNMARIRANDFTSKKSKEKKRKEEFPFFRKKVCANERTNERSIDRSILRIQPTRRMFQDSSYAMSFHSE